MTKLNPVSECLRCGNSWWRRGRKLPAKCPACGSKLWNKPYVRNIKIKAKQRGGEQHGQK